MGKEIKYTEMTLKRRNRIAGQLKIGETNFGLAQGFNLFRWDDTVDRIAVQIQ